MKDGKLSRRRVLTWASGAIAGVVVGTAPVSADHEQNEEDCAHIEFDDQVTNCKRVVVESVYFPEGGFIDIHRRPEGAEPHRPADKDWQCGPSGCYPLGYPLGATGWREPGWHYDVTITLFSDVRCIEWEENDCLDEPTRMCAMPHRNSTDHGSFVHFCERGADPPYSCPPGSRPLENAVEDCATVTPREHGRSQRN